MAKALAIGIYLAFQMPSFHLVWIENGQVAVSIEDMTEAECRARQKTFKPRAQAQCVLDVGEREYS